MIAALPLVAEITLTWKEVGVIASVIAGASAWFYLPKQVATLEARVTAQDIIIKDLYEKLAATKNDTTEVKTTVTFIKEQVEKIAAKMNIT